MSKNKLLNYIVFLKKYFLVYISICVVVLTGGFIHSSKIYNSKKGIYSSSSSLNSNSPTITAIFLSTMGDIVKSDQNINLVLKDFETNQITHTDGTPVLFDEIKRGLETSSSPSSIRLDLTFSSRDKEIIKSVLLFAMKNAISISQKDSYKYLVGFQVLTEPSEPLELTKGNEHIFLFLAYVALSLLLCAFLNYFIYYSSSLLLSVGTSQKVIVSKRKCSFIPNNYNWLCKDKKFLQALYDFFVINKNRCIGIYNVNNDLTEHVINCLIALNKNSDLKIGILDLSNSISIDNEFIFKPENKMKFKTFITSKDSSVFDVCDRILVVYSSYSVAETFGCAQKITTNLVFRKTYYDSKNYKKADTDNLKIEEVYID